MLRFSWNSYQELLAESSRHKLKPELTAESILGSSGISVQTGLLLTLSFPPRYWVTQSALHCPRCWDLAQPSLCTVTLWTVYSHAADCLGGELPYCCFFKDCQLSLDILSFRTLSEVFLEGASNENTWVLRDLNVPRIHLTFLVLFPFKYVVYIFSPNVETMWLKMFPISSSWTHPLSTSLPCL